MADYTVDDLSPIITGEVMDVLNREYASFDSEQKRRAEEQHKRQLREAIAVEKVGSEARKKHQKELNALQRADIEAELKRRAEAAETLAEREAAQAQLREMALQAKIDEKTKERINIQKTAKEKELEKQEKSIDRANKAAEMISGGLDKMYSQMTSAAQTYSSYVDKMATRLYGANETYGSISDKISQAFGSSPFFKLSTVFDKVIGAIDKGISFNIENRAAMQVISEKVATTFEAFSESLLRLVRIQQDDSTQARLGMESLLNQYFNANYQDTSYLNSLSKTVSSSLIEASSIRTKEQSTELEYVIQKYLGSLYSVGVSDSLITQLAQGIGYLASGDISSLSSNSALEQLLVASANRGGGTSYGEMLTGKFGTGEVVSIIEGLYSLVSEISNTGAQNNIVALNQYAKVFGMTVSDITSVLNISSEALGKISKDLKTYNDMTSRVEEETTFSKLFSRTGGATLGENLYQNFIQGAGKGIGANAASYLSWQLAGTMSSLLKGVETGIDIQPFGVGTHMNLSVGDIMKSATVAGGALAGIASMMKGLGSLSGVDLAGLGVERRNTVTKGSLVTMASEGTNRSLTSYTGDYSEGALAKSSNAVAGAAATKYSDADFDAEKKKTEEYQKKMSDLGNDVKFIVQLLNESGIVIRGRSGMAPAASFFDEIVSGANTPVLGVTVR